MGAFGPGAWSRRTTRTRRPRPTPSSTTPTACSMRATSCSSTRPAPASAASPARTRRRRSTASIRDAHAFARVHHRSSSSKYGRWNSPKYLFGESYGTPRSAVLANMLETERDIDFNGVILLSQILNFDLSADGPRSIRASTCRTSSRCRPMRRPPGITTSCRAASGRSATRCSRRSSSSRWAIMRAALAARLRSLTAAERDAIAEKLHQFTGLARRLHRQGRSAHRRRRVREDAAGRRRH